ncbi:MAG TPA: hypothetical protein PKA41_07165 [Verrucomicrobiota bacterium]|nr:hypothetical protein [Verrucomicrobiota bacterium]
MRILLQNKTSGEYFKDVGSWTRNASEAMDFLSSMKAIDFCVANKMSSVQIVLKFDEQHYDIVLPMKAERDGPMGRLARAA